jgi:hypothetical protein
MKNPKILEAFKMRKNGYSLTQIEKATGIKRPYLSFMFQNFNYGDIIKIAETDEPVDDDESWWEQLSWWEIVILFFAGIGVITTFLKVLKWLGI